MKESNAYQVYHIHLLNEEVIDAVEAFEFPTEKSLIGKIKKLSDSEVITIGDAISGFIYIPKRSILFITTGDVKGA